MPKRTLLTVGTGNPNRFEPYQHQREAYQKTLHMEYFGYFCEQGTGKSRMLIDDMEALYRAGAIEAVVIVAPKAVGANWQFKEIPEHAAHPWRVLRYVAERAKQFREELTKEFNEKEAKGLRWFVFNVEAFSDSGVPILVERIMERFKTAIAVDESHTIKNMAAKRTKNLLKLGGHGSLAVAKRVLSGTPSPNKPDDVYSQMEFLKKGCLGFKSIFVFRAKYAEQVPVIFGSRSFKKVVGYRNLDDLYKRLDKLTLRLTKKDCLDLPDKIYSPVFVELPKKVVAMYQELRREAVYIFEKEGRAVFTSTGAGLMQKLHQCLQGFIYNEGDVVEVDSNKLDALTDIIDSLPDNEPVVIWATYRPTFELIARHLASVYKGQGVAELHGATPSNAREEMSRQFIDGECRFMVANPAVAGMGLTWTHCSNVVYYSNSFSLQDRLQSEDRCHRIGQVNKVTYYDLIGYSEDIKETIDGKVCNALRAKKNLMDTIVSGRDI